MRESVSTSAETLFDRLMAKAEMDRPADLFDAICMLDRDGAAELAAKFDLTVEEYAFHLRWEVAKKDKLTSAEQRKIAANARYFPEIAFEVARLLPKRRAACDRKPPGRKTDAYKTFVCAAAYFSARGKGMSQNAAEFAAAKMLGLPGHDAIQKSVTRLWPLLAQHASVFAKNGDGVEWAAKHLFEIQADIRRTQAEMQSEKCEAAQARRDSRHVRPISAKIRCGV